MTSATASLSWGRVVTPVVLSLAVLTTMMTSSAVEASTNYYSIDKRLQFIGKSSGGGGGSGSSSGNSRSSSSNSLADYKSSSEKTTRGGGSSGDRGLFSWMDTNEGKMAALGLAMLIGAVLAMLVAKAVTDRKKPKKSLLQRGRERMQRGKNRPRYDQPY